MMGASAVSPIYRASTLKRDRRSKSRLETLDQQILAKDYFDRLARGEQ
jgi:hypothetical protein